MVSSTINTNVSALIALQNLRTTQDQLNVVQKRVSTGYNVSDALDNGAIFGIAQTTRSAITGSVAANQELGNFIGAVQTANAGATGVSNTLSDVRATLTHLADSFLTGTQSAQYQQQFNNLIATISTYVSGATYNGVNLISTGSTLSVIQDGNGSLLTITGTLFNINSALNGISIGSPSTYTNAGSVLLTTFGSVLGSVATVLNLVGDLNTKANLQISFNQSVQDALTVGLGAIVDADLAKESANLTALQIKQQLGTQTLGIANQAPNVLLGLFK